MRQFSFLRFLRYVGLGVISFALGIGTTIALVEFGGMQERIAAAIGLAIAFVTNFFTIRRFVFSGGEQRLREFVKFTVASLLFRLSEYAIFYGLHVYFEINYVLAYFAVTATAVTFKYYVHGTYVFASNGKKLSANPDNSPVHGEPPGDGGLERYEEIDRANKDHHIMQTNLQLLPSYYRWTYGKFKKFLRGDVLELGCGAGHGIPNYIDGVRHLYAVDYNQQLLDRVGQRFPRDKVTPISADLMGNWSELSEISCDAILMMDVLEHFPDDKLIIEHATRLLKPGGVIAIKVPAQSRLYCSVDRATGHYRRYDLEDLAEIARAASLTPVVLREMNPLGLLAYRLKQNQKKNFSSTFSSWQLKVIDLLIPVIALFDLIPRLPGQSVLAVLRKSEAG